MKSKVMISLDYIKKSRKLLENSIKMDTERIGFIKYKISELNVEACILEDNLKYSNSILDKLKNINEL